MERLSRWMKSTGFRHSTPKDKKSPEILCNRGSIALSASVLQSELHLKPTSAAALARDLKLARSGLEQMHDRPKVVVGPGSRLLQGTGKEGRYGRDHVKFRAPGTHWNNGTDELAGKMREYRLDKLKERLHSDSIPEEAGGGRGLELGKALGSKEALRLMAEEGTLTKGTRLGVIKGGELAAIVRFDQRVDVRPDCIVVIADKDAASMLQPDIASQDPIPGSRDVRVVLSVKAESIHLLP